MKTKEPKITVPGEIFYLPIVVRFVSECVSASGLSTNEINQIELAVEEAVANVIVHALQNNPDENFTVICRCTTSAIEIIIKEKGLPFNPEAIPEFKPENLRESKNTEGLGTFLLKQAMDEIQYRNLGREGKETILIKHLSSKRIEAVPSADEKIPQPEVKAPAAEKIDYILRSFKEQDAIKISRCAYSVFGYSFSSCIYYPEQITEMNHSGKMLSMIAEDPAGNLLGHIALKFKHKDDLVPEADFAFVEPEYRDQGVFADLYYQAISETKDRGLLGLSTKFASSSDSMQKTGAQLHFVPCGVLLGGYAPIEQKKALDGAGQRENYLQTFLSLKKGKEKTIYPPANHKEIIQKILTETGCSYSVSKPSADNSIEMEIGSILDYSISKDMNIAEIFCQCPCLESISDILYALRKFCAERYDVIYLNLNLENPNVSQVTEACERLGFFFSGVLPYGLHGCHTLVMQYLNNLIIDYTKIKTDGKLSHDILAYVKKSDLLKSL